MQSNKNIMLKNYNIRDMYKCIEIFINLFYKKRIAIQYFENDIEFISPLSKPL